MLKRSFAVAAVFLISAFHLSAGDVASFVNLGFSEDARVFMFAQYGIERETSRPFAEIYTVDVPNNVFVENGVRRSTFDIDLNPGQNGSGAMYTLLGESQDLISRYEIDHLAPGRIVYLLVNGDEPKSNIQFRDFNTGNRYEISLVQVSEGEGEDARASFHIQLTVVRSNGEVDAFTVGRPGYFRDGVSRYRIGQIFLAPDEQSLVFVVQKEYQGADGTTIRYMVETVSF
jgi:predicted secreted protein